MRGHALYLTQNQWRLIGVSRYLSSAASTVLSVVYGWPPLDSTSDDLVRRINGFMHRILAATLPGAYLVEVLPSLRHLPAILAPWKRKGLRCHQEDTEMFETFAGGVKDKMVLLWCFRGGEFSLLIHQIAGDRQLSYLICRLIVDGQGEV